MGDSSKKDFSPPRAVESAPGAADPVSPHGRVAEQSTSDPATSPQGSSPHAAEDVSHASEPDGVALEADAGNTPNDPAEMDERISNYTASLASSVVDYPIEYGRRYHAFRPGVYAFPNDEAEMDRLDMSHAVKVRSIGNKLFLAPLEKEKVHRILDIGTGTGIWAIEMGDVFENAEIIGIDLSPIQPKWVPPNVKFEVDDVESPWVVSRKYNYIMCRHMVASILDWPKLVRNIYDNLEPGGWAEFQELSVKYHTQDGTFTEDHATYKWNRTLIEACKMIGRDACPGPKVEGWVRDQGFRNVHHQKFMLPVGPWPKDPHYRDIGMLNLAQTLEGLEGFSLKLFCGVLGRTKEEVFVELSQVRKELKTGAFHAMFDLHVVYGQKPFETEAEE
ncbi:Secondary metabolism regulator LAE1 [Colletotrichum fructicola]|nr:Secondary metabolism regulator LAE1 [Colletotrichum fructicola]KAF4932992.1 Secondary metabolism regulator LAE1 [Colletotrichum fructicola]